MSRKALPRTFVPFGTPVNTEWNAPAPSPGTHGLGWHVEPGDTTPGDAPGYCWCGVWAEDCDALRVRIDAEAKAAHVRAAATRSMTAVGGAVDEFGDLLTDEERAAAGRLVLALDEIARGRR